MRRFALLIATLGWMGLQGTLQTAHADVPLPANVTEPPTAVEAWNVIHLATANMDKLVAEPRLSEVDVQASLCTPALRTLVAQVNDHGERTRATFIARRAALALGGLVQACHAGDRKQAERQLRDCHVALDELKPFFDAKTAAGDIYFCAMHPEVISENALAPCTRCGMKLFPRRIPHSFVFVPSGEATMKLDVLPGTKLEAGKRAEVRFKLARRDGVPVMLRDLMVMHTQPIHLLIVDPTLQDYHHEHPAPAAFSQAPASFGAVNSDMCGPAPRGSGEYVFSFTPRTSGPYRVFAELVPVDSGIQEYARMELAGTDAGSKSHDPSEKLEASVDDLRFKLSFLGLPGLRARQTHTLQIVVMDKEGKPFTQLEPFMNAFAHLVGFYDDGATVAHVHPEGGDVLRNDVRGGPHLNFLFYPPKAGFLRLFCQVRRDGRDVMAPFGVVVME